MRVVVIARSFTRGGSATGAANLVKALESVDLEVVTLDSELSIQKRNIYRFLYYLERALDRVVFGKSVSYFRIRPHTFSLDEILQQYNPDVIQLCDISSHAFNLKNIKNSNIPIFHRLSDFWPYLGKKHYPEKNDVVACSDLYKKKSTLHLVTPSEWLKNEFVDRLKLDSNMHPSIIYNATYVAESYLKILNNSSLFIPQKVQDGYTNTYYTFAARFLGNDCGISWYDFRKKYMEFGGDGIYAAHQLVYNEPCFRQNNIGYGKAPVSEKLQKELMLFTTNQRNEDERKSQTIALQKTLDYFK